MKLCRLIAALALVAFVLPGALCAQVFQFSVLAASADWIVLRENISVSSTDLDACRYPGLDPSSYVGVTVHFVRLTPGARRGQLSTFEKADNSMVLYDRGQAGKSCTSEEEAGHRWADIVAHAKGLGISLDSQVSKAAILGNVVPDKACALITEGAANPARCSREFQQFLKGKRIRIAVSLAAVLEAPDERLCQFVGYRFGATVQVAGLNMATIGSGVAPGGMANHYDCRHQQFDPLRLYRFDRFAVLLGDFRGANIADHDEHPFYLVFPAQTVP